MESKNNYNENENKNENENIKNNNNIGNNNCNNCDNYYNKNEINSKNKYKQTLICLSDNCCSKTQQKCIRYSNKIIIPSTILTELLCENAEMPYFFRVVNPEIAFGVMCGIHEATAPDGFCYIPTHIMDNLNLRDGNNVTLKLLKPKDGTYIKLQPHSMDFVNMKNVEPKQLLEVAMSMNYPILTEGHTIVIYCEVNKRSYYLDVVETKPAEEIKIIDVNLNVDFDPPKDYLRKKKKEEEEKCKKEEEEKKRKDGELLRFIEEEKNGYNNNKFPGRGVRLGSS